MAEEELFRRGTVLVRRLRLEPGEHTLAFRFEGRVGGCNSGSVASWGGEIAVRGKRKA